MNHDGHGTANVYHTRNRHTRHKLVLHKQLHTPTVRKGGSDLRHISKRGVKRQSKAA